MEAIIQDIFEHGTMQMRATQASDIMLKHGANTIVLFHIGNTYETYNDNAEQVHKVCKFPIIYYGKIAHLDFKDSCDFWVFPKMVREGFKICIIEN